VVDESGLNEAIQANFTAYLRKFGRLPGIELHEDPDITWFVSTVGAPGNHVVRTRLDPAGDTTARLRGVLAEIAQKADRLDWPLYPGDGPPAVAQSLLALGLEEQPGGPWMTADLTTTPAPPAPPATLALQRVADAAMLHRWLLVSAAGFEMTVEACQPYHDAYLLDNFDPTGDSLQVIGYVGAEAVTSGTLICSGGVAGVYDVSTPPQWRKRGYGTAATAWLLAAARARGYRYACLMASPAGVPIYQRLGFTLRFRPVEYCWRKNATPSAG
jgi:GNAT superfamily N-acetyltransferase